MRQLRGGQRILAALALTSLASLLLYIITARYYQASDLWFLVWNLFLAWLPLVFAIWLVRYLHKNPWYSWQGALLSLLWLGFLPNSFYLISDFIHLSYAPSNQALFYIIMLFSFSFSGLLVGFASLYLLHKELLRRLKPRDAHLWVATILLLCSFAVYLGRYLHWSTWDVILNPAGILFDVSDRLINPVAYGQTFQVTILFFILLGSMYTVLWQLIRALREDKSI